MASLTFNSYAIAHDSRNSEILLLTCDFSNPKPTESLPPFQQCGHYLMLCFFTTFSSGISKSFLKGMTFMLYFFKVTICFCSPPTVATTPLSQGKLQHLWKRYALVTLGIFQQVQEERVFLRLWMLFGYSTQFCIGAGCRLYKQHPDYLIYLLILEVSLFSHICFSCPSWISHGCLRPSCASLEYSFKHEN